MDKLPTEVTNYLNTYYFHKSIVIDHCRLYNNMYLVDFFFTGQSVTNPIDSEVRTAYIPKK